MENSGWYLMAYDIADPRRLSRIHRVLKKQGISVQKSVFLVQGTEQRIERLMDRIAGLMKLNEDDLRAYPVRDPASIWFFGTHPLCRFPLIMPGSDTMNKRALKPEGLAALLGSAC